MPSVVLKCIHLNPPMITSQAGSSWGYGYDDNGHIVRSTAKGKWIGYTYDALGQLTQVNDRSDPRAASDGSTWMYTYDQGGNILSKKLYPYADTSVEPISTMTFTYGDANWRDKLTAVNGVPITYDAIGNPLNDGTWTYTWQNGRQLKSMSKSGTTASFVYNADGLRVQKTVNGVVTKYTLHGKNVVHMTQGSNELHFFYDAQNRPAVVVYNGTAYAYVKNLQGDIVGILDNAGNWVVEYTYDAWGEPTSRTGSMADTLGVINPFRYRGYVYDQETGLYYLRSRYYNPECARFLNADIYVTTEQGLLDSNMFAYCQNNPFNRTDPTGTWSWSSFFDTACKVVGTVAAVVSATAIIVGTGGTAAVVVLGAACGGLIGGYYNEKAGGHYSSGFVGGVVSSLVQTYAGKFFGPCGTWLGGAFGSGLGTCVAGAMDNMYLPADERKSGADIWNATQRTFAVALVTSGVTALMGSGFQYAYETNGIDGLMVGMDEAFANIGNQFFGSVDDAITYMLLMENE